jgi:hypothetical protein
MSTYVGILLMLTHSYPADIICTKDEHSWKQSRRYSRFDHLRRALRWEEDTLIMISTVMPYTMYADDSGKKNQ